MDWRCESLAEIIKKKNNLEIKEVIEYPEHPLPLPQSSQFSLYVHKGGLKPDSFHFRAKSNISDCLF